MTLRTATAMLLFASGSLFAQTGQVAGNQTYTGILLDANCQQIASGSTRAAANVPTSGAQAANSPHAGLNSSGASTAESRAGAGSAVQASTTAPAATGADAAGRTGSGLSTGTTGSGLSSGQTGTGHSGSSMSETRTENTNQRAANTPDTGTASSGTGRTAAAAASDPNLPPRSPAAEARMQNRAAGTGVTDGTRARTAAANITTHDYHACRVTPATTAYAIYAQGRVIPLDGASQERVRQQLRDRTLTTGNDLNVTVSGSMQGDNLSLSTISIQ